jgi:hypothetical protein
MATHSASQNRPLWSAYRLFRTIFLAFHLQCPPSVVCVFLMYPMYLTLLSPSETAGLPCGNYAQEITNFVRPANALPTHTTATMHPRMLPPIRFPRRPTSLAVYGGVWVQAIGCSRGPTPELTRHLLSVFFNLQVPRPLHLSISALSILHLLLAESIHGCLNILANMRRLQSF